MAQTKVNIKGSVSEQNGEPVVGAVVNNSICAARVDQPIYLATQIIK